MKVKLSSVAHLILFFLLIELFAGGGGRFFVYHNFTLRFFLFFLALGFTAFYAVYMGRINKLYYLPLVFIVWMLLPFGLGLYNGASMQLIYEDIKPLIFFLIFCFLLISIDSLRVIRRIKGLLILISVFMALSYIIVFCLIKSHSIDFRTFYINANVFGEFSFRENNGLFYKGFIYMVLGFFFIQSEVKSVLKWVLFGIVIVATYLSFTRGFFVALFMTYFVYYTFLRPLNYNRVLLNILFLFFTGLGLIFYFDIVGARPLSSFDRLVTIEQVIESTDLTSFFIGHGFGIGVEKRPIHMEISYLEIFHKQGIIGLAFWFFLLLKILRSNFQLGNEYKSLYKPFLLGVIFVYTLTAFNPFLNNPIGMSFVLLSFVTAEFLKKSESINSTLLSANQVTITSEV